MLVMTINLNDLTVVLPNRNESHNIRNFLKSVPESLKLVIADASEDSTPDIVSSSRPDYTFSIRHNGTVTEARRIGAELATTTWLLFTDADIVFSEDYFRNLADLEDCNLIYGPKLSLDHVKTYYKGFACGQYLIHVTRVPAAFGSDFINQ